MAYSLSGFNGQRPDPVSGHSHLGNGYRAYTPVPGRFTTPDSMSPFGAGGINPYAYCAGDPVNRADPSGHFSLGQGLGMALGLVGGFVLGVLTEGMALPVVASLLANMAGDAAIGALSELATEAVDGQQINGRQVGMAALVNAGFSLAGFGLGRLSKLKGTRNRPFGGLMMEGNNAGASGSSGLSSLSGGSGEYVQFSMSFPVNPKEYQWFSAGVEAKILKKGNKLLKTYNAEHSVEPEELQNEVTVFNLVYGDGVAKIKPPQSIKMPLINGRPLTRKSVVKEMTAEHAGLLRSSLDRLHGLTIHHGDIHAGNILFDKETRSFNFIDFRYSSLGIDLDQIEDDHHEIRNIIETWPKYTEQWQF
jgi:RHS repeat-associated protein